MSSLLDNMYALLPSFVTNTERDAMTVEDQVVVFQGKKVKVIVPILPLSPGSLQIIPEDPSIKSFSQWDKEHIREAHHLMVVIFRIWLENNIATQSEVYGVNRPLISFRWEIIPYLSTDNVVGKRNKLCFNLAMEQYPKLSQCCPLPNASHAKQRQQEALAKFPGLNLFNVFLEEIPSEERIVSQEFIRDRFTQKALEIFKGEKVSVFYGPKSEETVLHFLITSNFHRKKFTDLTREEHSEMGTIVQKIVEHYRYTYNSWMIINRTLGDCPTEPFSFFCQEVVLSMPKDKPLEEVIQTLKSGLGSFLHDL